MSVDQELLWRRYLFEVHTEDVLRAWARRLQLFRFCRAAGGHANEDDSLTVAYAVHGERDIEAFFDTLGITLRRHASQPPQAEPGKRYHSDEWARFPSLIAGTRWLEQPQQCRIAEQPVHAWSGADRVTLRISRGYAVDDDCVRSAERVEQALSAVAAERIDPPLGGRLCISPAQYPDWFA